MTRTSVFHRFIVALAFGVGAVTPAVGHAQSISVAANLKRKVPTRPNAEKPTWISYNDCILDDVLTFELTMSTFQSYTLEAWVGAGSANCTEDTARKGDAATCRHVFTSSNLTTPMSVPLRAQDIVSQEKPGSPGTATVTSCDEGPDGTSATIYFLLVDGGGAVQGFGSFANTGYDLVGPNAPTGVGAGIGEDRLIVSWDDVTSDDLLGYRIYCDPRPGLSSPQAVGGAAGTSARDSGTVETDSGADAGIAGQDSGAGGSTATDAGAGGNPNCPSSALIPGSRPDAAYQCGSVTGKVATEGHAEGLVNGVKYAVAVAALDEVGNVGPLSAVACGSPQVVDDFFELYRRAGGKGGGGFCGLTREPAPGLALLFAAALLLLRLRRRAAC